jgi:hypothetical protein
MTLVYPVWHKMRILVGAASDKAFGVKMILERFSFGQLSEGDIHRLEQVKARLDGFWRKTMAESKQEEAIYESNQQDSPSARMLFEQRLEDLTLAIDELYFVLKPIEQILSIDDLCSDAVELVEKVRNNLHRDLDRIHRGEELPW